MEQKFKLKGGSQSLEIVVLKYSYPNEMDTYDGNWLDILIAIKAGSFFGKYGAYFQTADFLTLKDGLQKLYNKLDGTFTFNTLEGQLEMVFVGDGLGHINIDCKAQDEAGRGNILQFELSTDQTELKNLTYQVDEILKAFPIK